MRFRHLTHDLDRLIKIMGFAVGTVGIEGVKHIGKRHDTSLDRDMLTFETGRIALAVVTLMMVEDDIDNRVGHARLAGDAGGQQFSYIDCLNDSPDWIRALTDLVENHLQGWPTKQADDPMALKASRERALAMGAKD